MPLTEVRPPPGLRGGHVFFCNNAKESNQEPAIEVRVMCMQSVRIFSLSKLLIFLVLGLAGQDAFSADRPNILFIMSDDHAANAIGAYRSRLADLNPTPTIDRLAQEGMRFDSAFSTNAICTPSRATVMTGQYPQTHGVLDLDGKLTPENQYLAHEMKELGYQTAMVGKWHLKEPPAAFDYFNVLPGQGDYFDPVLYSSDHGKKRPIKFDEDMIREVNAVQYEGHSSDVITDISLEWLKSRWDRDRPFFMMHHFKAPHDFFEFAQRYETYLDATVVPEPDSMYNNANNGSVATRGLDDELVHTIGSSIGHRNTIRNMGMHMDIDPMIPDPKYTHMAYQEYLKRYLRCVKGVDDNINRLLEFLEAEGVLDDTIIIYTSDQGFMLGEHDYIDKRWMYEESMQIPLLVRYPRLIEAGTTSDALVNNTDLAPTIITLAGGQTPEYMQGHSFSEILHSGEEPDNWREATYYRYWMHMAHQHSNPAHFGIRTKDFKLIFFYGRDYVRRSNAAKEWADHPESMSDMQTPVAWEFYDLKNDPREMDNRYGDKRYMEVIEDLKEQLKALREELNEGDDKYPHIAEVIDQYWNEG